MALIIVAAKTNSFALKKIAKIKRKPLHTQISIILNKTKRT